MRASGGGGVLLRVRFDLGHGLYEDGEVSLHDGVRSVKVLRIALLQLADELLLDPEDDLGEWTLTYTDRASGRMLPVGPSVGMGELRKRAQELRVTAGPPLRRR